MSGIGGIGSAGGVRDIMAMRQQILDRSELLRELHAPTGQPAAPPVADPQPAGFGAALTQAFGAVNASQARAESVVDAYQRGEVTDVAKVMLARQEAGIAFEATLQVRNRLLNAYQDIMRMGV
jgi:flagellar hook-basal body complex protein FliE